VIDQLRRDLGFALRTYAKTPLITAVAIGVLALGIAATSVSFSVVNALFVRPLPIQDAGRFVRVYSLSNAGEPFPMSYAEYEDVLGLTHVFDGGIAEAPAPLIVGGSESPERVWGEVVSDRYFEQLGVVTARGRAFSPGEDAVVISDGFWKRRFGGSSTALNATLLVEGRPYRIAGIATDAFHGTTLGFSSDLWMPARAGPARSDPSAIRDVANRDDHQYFVMARLGPGVSVEQAQDALVTLSARHGQERSSGSGARLAAFTDSEGRFPTVRDSVFGFSMLTVAVGLLVTLVACTNIACVLLARSAARRHEIATRVAVGASRGRIIRQLLTEAAVLAIVAGALGIAAAWQATRLLSAFEVSIARGATASVDVSLDYRVLAISVVLTLLTSVLCGLTPALHASRADLVTVLRNSPRDGRRSRSWGRRVLLGGQVALSMMLLAGGGLFVRSFAHARNVDLGFDPEHVVTAAVDTGSWRDKPETVRFWTTLLDEVRGLPDTKSAGMTWRLPLELGITRTALAPDPFTPAPGQAWPDTEFAAISPSYFDAIGTPLLEGRDFDRRDASDAPRVVILNDVLANRFWPGESAVGRYVVSPDGERLEVVGVARRAKYFSIGERPTAYAYFPMPQSVARSMTIVGRTSGDIRAYGETLRATVRRLDPAAPVDIALMSDRVRLALAPAAGSASALGIVSALALLLTSLGLFGAVAQEVGRRAYEIGVRRALGAQDRDVARLVLVETVTLIACGLGTGLVAALAASRPLGAVLYDVNVADPLVFGATPVVLVIVCLAAAWLPASRALRINAATALRHE
jgi:predicted permease